MPTEKKKKKKKKQNKQNFSFDMQNAEEYYKNLMYVCSLEFVNHQTYATPLL